ncbi:efflux RND transporter periplasmic adaptor subunit [Algihabitans albus]|uniref:efflux RND transporter periplasmic adaptor subunit n=1 Tax=Algihabitans albus TaxID=2164067 RepID=UPI0013C31488|nr:efflux RND transporter periplasmic adaptor subunit [Algihabitans albus]
MSVRVRKSVLALPLLLGFAVAGGPFMPSAAAQGGPPASPVHVDEVVRAPLSQTAPAIGRVVARKAGPVATRIDGAVAEYLVEVGDRVNDGQPLALIDDAVLAAQRELAAAQLSEAEALIATRRAGITLAEQEMRRIEGLRSSAAFSQARYDDQRQTVAIARAELNEAESAVASAGAELELAELNVYYAEVRAPYAGVVTERHSEAGAYLRTGEPVVSLVAVTELEIEVEVPFMRLGGLTPGTQVNVQLADRSMHTAVVRAVIPNEDPRTRTRPVRLLPQFGSVDTPLAPGQSVTVQVPVGTAREIVSVAKDAILPRGGGGQQIFVFEEGQANLRDVDLGVAVGNRFEVLEGLQVGDLVVVRGNERLRDGQAVIPVNLDAEGGPQSAPNTAQTDNQG